jgi:hypothetical protein
MPTRQTDRKGVEGRGMRQTCTSDLQPTPAQARVLEQLVSHCHEPCNAGLEERRRAWDLRDVSVRCALHVAQLPAITEARPA